MLPFLFVLCCASYGVLGRRTYEGVISENARPNDVVRLDRNLHASIPIKDSICGYVIYSAHNDIPFRVLLKGVNGEADLVLKDGVKLDRDEMSQYNFEMIPYTCSDGRHLSRKKITVAVLEEIEVDHEIAPAPDAAIQESPLEAMELPFISKIDHSKSLSNENRMSRTSTAIIVVVAVAVVGFVVALAVMRIRARRQSLEPEKTEMEWDNTEMKITLNPLEVTNQGASAEDMFANCVSDGDSESSCDESVGDNLSDLNDLDSSDNEDGHKDVLDLEWDNATLTFVEKSEIPT